MSEWCRQVLLEAAADPAPAPEAEAILSEVLALLKIVINRLYGEKAGEPFDRERMRELIESADAGKLARAAECLHAVRTRKAGARRRRNRLRRVAIRRAGNCSGHSRV